MNTNPKMILNMNENDNIINEEAKASEENAQEQKNEPKKESFASLLFDVAETVLMSTAAVILLFTFVLRITVVDGPSMNKTLNHGDVLIASDFMYEPEYGDIVVLQNVDSYYSQPIVKRVIATEGQVVDIDFSTWTVTVDGNKLDESAYRYLATDALVTSNIEYPVTVPEGCIFVMGDNRNHSADSRNPGVGLIKEDQIYGKALARYYPIKDFHILTDSWKESAND